MMLLSEAAQILGAKMVGGDVRFTSVSTDSRKIEAGNLFIALRGENFDGAGFVANAVRDGAVAAMVNADGWVGSAPCPVLLVADTRLALGRLAAHWRAQFEIPLVGLTGSNGKTTVKEMLASILCEVTGGAESVLATQGNLNNDIGLPLTLLRLHVGHRFAVIEMGMNHPGEIEYLSRLADPDVAIITNASGAHLAGLGSVEGVARAKGEIFAGLKPGGTAVINADDEYAPLWRRMAEGRAEIEFGLKGFPAVLGKWQAEGAGARLSVLTPQGEFAASLQVPGVHNARNALAATAAAVALGVPLEKIALGLEKFGGVAGRLQRKAARNGAALIDDTYNANPASMRAALEVLAQASGKRIFVMGDMGELGENAPRFHAEIGAVARHAGIQRLLALGELSREAVREFGAGAQHFADVESLCAVLDGELAAGTTVLVKGSRFMKMERVVARCIEGEETCCSH
ncbi:MAG TPA: UDP-N-acetylmuramoyl-tripeptide--D-alanyl-D-alanine ligase [Gallionellaceae bacterium]